jgi:hypothetical protein
MKRVIQICSLLIILICNLQSQTPENKFIGAGAPYKNINEVTESPSEVNLVYELELFPGQVFNGWYYYWSTGSTATGNFQINPVVSWLSISPNTFTSTSCSDIVPISYNFIAPQTPGTYNAVIQDLNGIWENTNVTLHVTENPTTAFVRSYQVNQGQTISQYDTLHWNGFGQFGCQSNYIPGNTKLFNFIERNPATWFSINPSSITVPIFGEGVVESVITGNTPGNDYVYIIEEAQYSHICFFIRVELNVITDVENENALTTPEDYSLEQNYPNPFNPSTKIKYTIPSVFASETKQSQIVSLKVYDVLGYEVATLVNEEKPAGVYEVEFDASTFSSGIYFYELQAGSFVKTKKMILLK